MIEKHAFGNPMRCHVCEQPVDAVWAETYEAALAGQGICQTCLDVALANGDAKRDAAPQPQPPEGESDV